MTRQGRMHHKKAKKHILTQDLNHSLTNQCTRFFLHWYLGFKAIALTVPDRNKSNSSYNKTQIRWHYCFTVVIYGKIINNFKVSYFGHMTVVREKRQYWLLCFPPGVRMIRSLKNVFTLIFLRFSLPFLLVLQNAGSHLPRVSELHGLQDHSPAPLWFSFYFPTRFILKIINRQILMHKHIWTKTPFINRKDSPLHALQKWHH